MIYSQTLLVTKSYGTGNICNAFAYKTYTSKDFKGGDNYPYLCVHNMFMTTISTIIEEY